jgi:hypothetical protein
MGTTAADFFVGFDHRCLFICFGGLHRSTFSAWTGADDDDFKRLGLHEQVSFDGSVAFGFVEFREEDLPRS